MLKVTKKFLLELKNSEDRTMCSVRINNDLYKFARKDAVKNGMSFVDYMNNLLLAKHLNDQEGIKTFACLTK